MKTKVDWENEAIRLNAALVTVEDTDAMEQLTAAATLRQMELEIEDGDELESVSLGALDTLFSAIPYDDYADSPTEPGVSIETLIARELAKDTAQLIVDTLKPTPRTNPRLKGYIDTFPFLTPSEPSLRRFLADTPNPIRVSDTTVLRAMGTPRVSGEHRLPAFGTPLPALRPDFAEQWRIAAQPLPTKRVTLSDAPLHVWRTEPVRHSIAWGTVAIVAMCLIIAGAIVALAVTSRDVVPVVESVDTVGRVESVAF